MLFDWQLNKVICYSSAPLTNDIGPGPFEDTQFDIVVDVETTDDMEGVFEFQTDEGRLSYNCICWALYNTFFP